MIIFLNVLTIGGIADFYVRRLSLLYKLTALIFSFVVILILSAPPSSVSTIKNTLLRSYGTRALRHIRITVDIGYFENPLHDIIFIKISGIPILYISLDFSLQTYCCILITYLESEPYNQ